MLLFERHRPYFDEPDAGGSVPDVTPEAPAAQKPDELTRLRAELAAQKKISAEATKKAREVEGALAGVKTIQERQAASEAYLKDVLKQKYEALPEHLRSTIVFEDLGEDPMHALKQLDGVVKYLFDYEAKLKEKHGIKDDAPDPARKATPAGGKQYDLSTRAGLTQYLADKAAKGS